ncbi:MAG: CHAT domain-containing protein [Deltaproteobacteria bacterium]|nr:CHAT domain-containing protein [Deltaproteobacteria bacterium]
MLATLFLLFLGGCLPSSPGVKSPAAGPAAVIGEEEKNGDQAWQKGAFARAIAAWETAARPLDQPDDQQRQARVLAKLGRAYQQLGQLEKARLTLEKARELAVAADDARQEAVILGCLGNLYQALGRQQEARQALQQGLQLAEGNGCHDVAAVIYNDWGNFLAAVKEYRQAAAAYRQCMQLARQSRQTLLLATAQVNYATAVSRQKRYQEAEKFLDQARETLAAVEDSHEQVYAWLHVGLVYADLRSALPGRRQELLAAANEALATGARIARRLGDWLAYSYARGYAGGLYETIHRDQEALELSRQAVLAAQRAGAPEALYRWQWQTARLLSRLGESDAAIDAYRRTIYTLESIRQELEACRGDSLSRYREVAGSICLELVDLLLRKAKMTANPEQRTALLMEAREIVELLRVYELRNYFKDDCVDAGRENRVALDALCQKTAVVYPIVLPDRTALLVSLPTGLKQYTLAVDNKTLFGEIRNFRRLLEKRTTREYLPHARNLYDFLIRPLEADLRAQKVATLVFVPSGALRTIPLAALHDGRQFLLAYYATAIVPGLNLTDPTPVGRQRMQVMVAGVTRGVQGFAPLPYVEDEVQAIAKICPSITLLDQDFAVGKFRESLREKHFNILHIASHGQFKGDVDQSFILAFDRKLTMADLDEYIGFLRFRSEPLDLLTLSACETAAGDDLAALGLAGVAVRAGARSALATLWHINDAATAELVGEFYRQLLHSSVSRAMALQRAQLKLLHDPRYEHPAYWAAFLLINSWL